MDAGWRLYCVKTDIIWRARTENKCKLSAWILIQTADNLARRGWPHQASCALCNGPLETSQHLSLLCPFAQAVWNQVLSWERMTWIASVIGGRQRLGLYTKTSVGISMVWRLTLCGIGGKSGIGAFSKINSNRCDKLRGGQKSVWILPSMDPAKALAAAKIRRRIQPPALIWPARARKNELQSLEPAKLQTASKHRRCPRSKANFWPGSHGHPSKRPLSNAAF
jgi:hypothetical protein